MVNKSRLFLSFTFFSALTWGSSHGLANGLAPTPPMGWLSWARFTCETDCDTYPQDCISERLYMDMADRLVSDGYKELGYEFVNIDDCWAEKARDAVTNQLVADRRRFPNGIKALADYVHSLGLKLGIYGDIGTMTCAGYPGFWIGNGSSADWFLLDSETFASWGIDSLKVDGCYAETSSFEWMYPRLGAALNATGRPILYSCSWPAYQTEKGVAPDYKAISNACNSWRNFGDIADSWSSLLEIIDFYAKNQDTFAKFNGNFGLSDDESRAQMAIWSILSAPLLMSNDLRHVTETQKQILQNRHLIEVNQDKMGIMGKRIFSVNDIEVWRKPVGPVLNGSSSFAVVFFNRHTLGGPTYVSRPMLDILDNYQLASLYCVYDLFQEGKLIAKLSLYDNLALRVNPSGVRMVRLAPVFENQLPEQRLLRNSVSD